MSATRVASSSFSFFHRCRDRPCRRRRHRPGFRLCSCHEQREEEKETRTVSGEEFMRLHLSKQPARSFQCLSFYSSHVDAITTDPSSFVLRADDHGFNRGHAVFDTVSIDVATRTFQDLHYHLDRLRTSASMSFIPFPERLPTIKTVEKVVKDTVAAAFVERERRGYAMRENPESGLSMQARFYLTAGVGGFALSRKECKEGSAFYCVVIERKQTQTKTLRARTTPIAVKNKPFSIIKSTNYLQNCMIANDAEKHDADVGIWVSNDKVLEGPSANVAFVDDRGIFVAPKVDDVLDGVTMRRCFEFIEKGLLKDVEVVKCERKDCSFRELIVEKRAKECMMIGSVVQCVPIVKWDDVDIGRDEAGENDRNRVAFRLRELLEKDARGVRVS